MKRIKKLSVILTAFVSMCGISAVSASASEPYDSYSYDRWGDAVPSQAGYTAEKTVSGYDLETGPMKSPSDIFHAFDGNFYIADTGNNRIIAVNSDFTGAVRIYEKFRLPDGSETALKAPSGVFVSEYSRRLYIADSENSRILVSDLEGNVSSEITRPESAVYDKDKTFFPCRVIADKAGNVYAVLQNITTGAAMFSPDGEFTGFYGANRVQPTAEIISGYFARIFMSEEKLSRRTRNIPSGITGFDIDGDFIFTCTASSTQSTDTVKKLNSAGENIFSSLDIKIGDYKPVYDTSQNRLLEPSIVDIDISEDGNISCLDLTTGRVFEYDEDCNLLFITGTTAKQTGGFDHASALETCGGKIYVTDSEKDTVTIFSETEFGAAVHKASELHNGGYYEEALEPWLEVLKRDGNYRRANLGVAAAKLRSGEYGEAMKYARLADAKDIYAKAFEGRRTEFIKSNFEIILAAAVVAAAGIAVISRRMKKRKGKGEKQNDGS